MTVVDHQTANELINQRALENVAQLKLQHTANASSIQKAQAELRQLSQGREERFQGLQQSRAHAANLEGQHTHTETYVKLVKDTPREQDSLKTLSTIRKQWQDAKKELGKHEREATEADKADKAREQELTSTLQEQLAEQERLEQAIHSVERAREQAKQAEGAEKQAEARQAIEEKHAQVEALEAQLVEAKLSALDAHTQALEKLKDWPDLQREIAQLREPDDATIRVLKANIAYLELLEQDAEKVASPFLPSLHRGGHVEKLYSELFLGDKIAELIELAYHAANHNDYQQALKEGRVTTAKQNIRGQRQQLQQLLEEYRASK